MAKVAKLVYFSLMTRIICDELATQEQIMELALPKVSEKLLDSPFDALEEIVNDLECPYSESDEENEKLVAEGFKHFMGVVDTVGNTPNINQIYEKLGEYTANDESEYPAIIKELKEALATTPILLVDYLDSITIWEKVEFSFTVKEFCELIGLK